MTEEPPLQKFGLGFCLAESFLVGLMTGVGAENFQLGAAAMIFSLTLFVLLNEIVERLTP